MSSRSTSTSSSLANCFTISFSSSGSRRPSTYDVKSLMRPVRDSTITSSLSFSGQCPAKTSYCSLTTGSSPGSSSKMSVDIESDIRLFEVAVELKPSDENDVSGLICRVPSVVLASKICGVTAYS